MSCLTNFLSRSRSNGFGFIRIGLFLPALVVFVGAHAPRCEAQLIYSVGTQEVYDSNIFLESKHAAPIAPQAPNGTTFKEFDGKINDDIISNPYVALAGRIPTGSKLVTNFTTKLGAVIYDKDNDENRFTVDGMVNLTPEDGVLPQYWTLNLSEAITSQAGAVGVAQGGASRQAQLNNITLSAGLAAYPITDSDTFSVPASISRQDFLGQFLFNSQPSDERQSIQGVDSLTYSLTPQVAHRFNDRWTVDVSNMFQYYQATGGDSNNAGAFDHKDNDRFNDTPSAGFNYTATERLSLGARAGVDFTSFTQDQNDSANTSVNDRSRTNSSLFYSGNVGYKFDQDTQLGANALQTAGTDIDGNRILARTVGTNASHIFSDRILGNASFAFTQFTQGDEFSGLSDRYEAVASLRYSLTDYLAVSAGYSYANQQRPSDGDVALFNNQDYEGHRVFVGLDTGFVAFTK